jgi:hypothetical protein
MLFTRAEESKHWSTNFLTALLTNSLVLRPQRCVTSEDIPYVIINSESMKAKLDQGF